MADDRDDTERSEDPTQKRLDEALERGDVAKSQEVNTWFVIACATLILMMFSGSMSSGITTTLRGLIANSYAIRVDGIGFVNVVSKLGTEVIAAMAIPFLLLALAAIGGNVVQHRLVWSAESLKPKLSKISPAAGIKRWFSKQALANFLKGLLKLGLIGTIMVMLLWPERFRLDALVATDPMTVLPLTLSLALKVLGAVVAVLALIAIADYLFQYRQWFDRQKMSLRELKDEFKQTEGDPAVKGKIRQIRQNRMRQRIMTAVPKASVVITNPTHFAVALQYERA
jgi:flagellar biosynthetic protein FlhB